MSNSKKDKYFYVSSFEERMINDKYPVKSFGRERITFTWFKIAIFGMMGYYIVEMVNRVMFIFFYEDDFGNPIFSEEAMLYWRIGDSVFYGLMFILIAIQVLVWRGQDIGLENKKKARNAFYALIISAILLGLYETLVILQADLQYSHRSDLAVPFLLMIIAHFYGLYMIRHLYQIFGKYNKIQVGTNIFYMLFALNPAIRYLSSFILLFMVPLITVDPYLFIAYSEVIMTYITAVVAVGFFVVLYVDSRRLKHAQLIRGLHDESPEELGPAPDIRIKYVENGDKILEIPLKNDASVFCPSCGIVVYDGVKICSKCGAAVK